MNVINNQRYLDYPLFSIVAFFINLKLYDNKATVQFNCIEFQEGLGGGEALPNSRRFKELFCVLDELLGCFEDSRYRVLESGPHSLQINGQSQCARHCATLGSYRYYGLQVTIWNNSFISYDFVCIYIV